MPKIENENEQIFEDISSDKLLELDNMSEEEKKELLEMSEKNEKLDIYFKNWMEIVKYFYLIDVFIKIIKIHFQMRTIILLKLMKVKLTNFY